MSVTFLDCPGAACPSFGLQHVHVAKAEHERVVKPRARRRDPKTSHEAAASVRNLTGKHVMVLEVLRIGPATDERIFELLHGAMSPSGARTRRSELVEMKMVEDTGETALTSSGRRTIVWRIVPA